MKHSVKLVVTTAGLIAFAAVHANATKVIVNKPAVQPPPGEAVVHQAVDTARLMALGAKVLADYPTYVLAEVPDAAAERFEEQARAEGFAAFLRPTFDQIRVNGYVFDARGGEPPIPPDLTISDYHGDIGLYLVQMIGPNRPEWYAAIQAVGEPIQYLADNTYIVRADPDKVDALRNQASLQHVSVYQPAYKLRADVAAATNPFPAVLQVDGGQDLASVTAMLNGIAGQPVDYEKVGPVRNAVLVLTPLEAKALAAMPEVLWIERNLDIRPSDERQALTVAGSHDGSKPINPGTYKAWLENKGFCTATKRTNCWDYWTKVAVFDTGLDDNWCASSPSSGGDCIASDNASSPDRHPDFKKYDGTSREKQFYCAGPASGNNYCKGYDGSATRWSYSDKYYHGTAVASVIAGDPLVPGGVGSAGRDRVASGDPLRSGFYLGSGIAPLAEILSFRIFDNNGATWTSGQPQPDLYYTPADWERWYGQLPSFPSTRFANNSWNMYDPLGVDTTYDIYYTAHSQRFDQLVRDANGGFNDYDHPMTILFSAGNSNARNAGNYVMSPGNAKNVLTVGAAESWRPWEIAPWDNIPAYCFPAADIKNVAEFSLRGVHADGNRYKPDLLAGGTRAGVAFTRAPRAGSPGCYADPAATDENDGYYTRAVGTSFAVPVVTGSAVLADAWYYYTRGSYPSPAMVKAILAASAERLVGGYDKLPNPDLQVLNWPTPSIGWGRVNLNRLFQGTIPAKYFDEDHRTAGEQRRFTAGEGSWSVPLRRADSTKDVIVALAFTDRFAAVNAMGLSVNNLDLYVLNGSYVYQGNVFYGCAAPPQPDPYCGYTPRSTGAYLPDWDNTVELVRIRPSDLVSETFTVEVVPGVNANAVPGLDSNGPNQDFALYVYNATNP